MGIGLVKVGLGTSIDIRKYSVFLNGVGKGSMTWVLTLDLSAARMGTKKEREAVYVDRLG